MDFNFEINKNYRMNKVETRQMQNTTSSVKPDKQRFQRSRQFTRRNTISHPINIQPTIIVHQPQHIRHLHHHLQQQHFHPFPANWLIQPMVVYPPHHTVAPSTGRNRKHNRPADEHRRRTIDTAVSGMNGVSTSRGSPDDIGSSYHPQQKIKKTEQNRRNRNHKNLILVNGKENHNHQNNQINSSHPKRLSDSFQPMPMPLTLSNIDNRNHEIIDSQIPNIKMTSSTTYYDNCLDLFSMLRSYVVADPNVLRDNGYPLECSMNSKNVEIYKHPLMSIYSSRRQQVHKSNSTASMSDGESGSSSPVSDFSENSNDSNPQVFDRLCPKLEKECARCSRNFYITSKSEYITQEECIYHWGKLYYSNGGPQYICCNGDRSSEGCSRNNSHTWSGLSIGVNGPYNDYVHTQKHINSIYPITRENTILALDCEMCYTSNGLELAKVTVINVNGVMLYEEYVRPDYEILDYNTRFSGINEHDLNGDHIKTLKDVQNDLLQFISCDTILIGHSLENDLRALKMVHKNVIDTSLVFPHSNGFPFKRGLKVLVKTYLKRDIQTSENGHSSLEDSQACLDLILWKAKEDLFQNASI